MSAERSPLEPAVAMLEPLPDALLDDFRSWCELGALLLDLLTDAVMPPPERQTLRAERQQTSHAQVPWHRLVMESWCRSARLRPSGVALPRPDWRQSRPLPEC
ncbi:MAG: hypothetical protein AAFX65_00445 [Cyanobacteria bacterium J06638_7]